MLVHGDYRLGNWLVNAGRGPAPHGHPRLGDGPPRRSARRPRLVHRASVARSHAARRGPGHARRAASHYDAASGRNVDADRLRLFEVLSIVKMIAIMHTGIRAFRDGRTRDLRMAIFDHQLPFLHAALAMLRRWLPGG